MSELYHHGIDGQKWGQKHGPPYPLDPKDHSPAELRKNPQIRAQIKAEKKEAKAQRKSANRIAKYIKISTSASKKGKADQLRKTAKSMTDEELKTANNRLTLENTFIRLSETNSPERQKRTNWAKEAVTTALQTVGTQVATVAISKMTNAAISKLLGKDVEWVNPMTGKAPDAKKNTNSGNSESKDKKSKNNKNTDSAADNTTKSVKDDKQELKELNKREKQLQKQLNSKRKEEYNALNEREKQLEKQLAAKRKEELAALNEREKQLQNRLAAKRQELERSKSLPDSFKLEPKLNPDGRVTWVPENPKKKRK